MPNKSTLCRVRANLIRQRINIVVMKYAARANNNMIIMIIIVVVVVKHLKTSARSERHKGPEVAADTRNRELALARRLSTSTGGAERRARTSAATPRRWRRWIQPR